MLTIEEVILHCEERAGADCSECAAEHRQLSEWLKELRVFRKKWIPVAEHMPTANEYRVVCAAHSGKPFLRRFEVAYITDTTEYQFGYFDGFKWMDKSNKVIPNVVAWKIHEPYNLQN